MNCEMVECPDCRGTGILTAACCPTCGGTGKVPLARSSSSGGWKLDLDSVVWQQAANLAVSAATGHVAEVPFSLLCALVESVRVAAEFKQTGTLAATRLPDGNIRVITTVSDASWRTV